MQVATVSTRRPDLRSEIEGWTFEDSSLFVRGYHLSNPHKIFIGYTPAPKDIPYYGTVLEMLADGWEMLAPPTKKTYPIEGEEDLVEWSWWLTRKGK